MDDGRRPEGQMKDQMAGRRGAGARRRLAQKGLSGQRCSSDRYRARVF